MNPMWVFENLTQTIRILNLILSGVALIWLLIRRFGNPLWYVGRLRRDIWLLAFWCAWVFFIGGIEIVFETGTTVRPILVTVALLIILRMLRRYAKDWYKLEEE